MQSDCIFCDIVEGKTETTFIEKTETLVVLKDINPHAPVHLLIVPKKHIRSINDLAPEDNQIISEMIYTGAKMAVKTGIADSGYKLLFNVERGGGQMVFHLHLHLMGGWPEKSE